LEGANLYKAIFERSPYAMVMAECITGYFINVNLIFSQVTGINKEALFSRNDLRFAERSNLLKRF